MSGEHWSDCALNSEPALPAGECDCGGFPNGQDGRALIDPRTVRAAIDACASAAEAMALDPIHGGDQWHEFADRLRAISRADATITATLTSATTLRAA